MLKQLSLSLVAAACLALAATCLLGTGAFAASSASATASSSTPSRGMTMAQVRARFGAPRKTLPPDPATAQGPLKPPIVRWVYPDFDVYFERGVVIHTVFTHPRKAPPIYTSTGG